MIYSTDRSKAVVPVLVLLFVALWFILRGDLLYVFPCVILILCFSVLWVLRLPRLGKRELILVFFGRLFDLCLFGFVGFLFLLGSGKGCGLWLWHSLDFSLTFFMCSGRTQIAIEPFALFYHSEWALYLCFTVMFHWWGRGPLRGPNIHLYFGAASELRVMFRASRTGISPLLSPLPIAVCLLIISLLQFFFIHMSVVSYITFVLSSFVPYLSFYWCVGKAVIMTFPGYLHLYCFFVHQYELVQLSFSLHHGYNWPFKPHFYIVKLGFTGVYITFFIFLLKHRLWVLVRTASPRRF